MRCRSLSAFLAGKCELKSDRALFANATGLPPPSYARTKRRWLTYFFHLSHPSIAPYARLEGVYYAPVPPRMPERDGVDHGLPLATTNPSFVRSSRGGVLVWLDIAPCSLPSSSPSLPRTTRRWIPIPSAQRPARHFPRTQERAGGVLVASVCAVRFLCLFTQAGGGSVSPSTYQPITRPHRNGSATEQVKCTAACLSS